MSRRLSAPDRHPRLLAPTTTTKLATRMLATSEAVLRVAPLLGQPIPRDIMLALLVSEDEASEAWRSNLPATQDLTPAILARWIAVLVHEGLVEERYGIVGLTATGYDTIMAVLEAIYAAQRALD